MLGNRSMISRDSGVGRVFESTKVESGGGTVLSFGPWRHTRTTSKTSVPCPLSVLYMVSWDVRRRRGHQGPGPSQPPPTRYSARRSCLWRRLHISSSPVWSTGCCGTEPKRNGFLQTTEVTVLGLRRRWGCNWLSVTSGGGGCASASQMTESLVCFVFRQTWRDSLIQDGVFDVSTSQRSVRKRYLESVWHWTSISYHT